MGRNLITRPSKSRAVPLREELLRFFDWDYCAALIANSLERQTAFALDALESRGEEEGLLWVQLSEEWLHEDMLRLYSVKPIRECLNRLVAKGVVVTAKESIGKVKNLLYDYNLVNRCVMERITFSQLPDTNQSELSYPTGKITDGKKWEDGGEPQDSHRQFSRKIAVELPKTDRAYNKVLQIQNTDSQISLPSFSESKNQNTSDPLEPVDPETGEILETLKPKTRWRPGSRKKEPRVGNGMSDRMRQLRQTAQDAAGAGVAALLDPQRQSTGPQVPAKAPMDFPARWNELVPACPVEWNSRIDKPLLDAALRDEVLAPRFEEICQKAQAIHEANPSETEWLTFRWILRYKDGAPNWWKIASGEIRPKKTTSATPKVADGVAIAAKMRAEMKLKKEQEDAARAKAADQIPG
jgi:hypothetical protein